MASIEVKAEGQDKTYTIDLDPDTMTLREHVRLQRQVGTAAYDRFIADGIVLRADFLEGFLYARLASQVPDLKPEDIDVDFVGLIESLQATYQGKAEAKKSKGGKGKA